MKRHWPCVIGISILLLTAPGCARFWDEMLSHERDWSYATGIGKPNPLIVIRDTTDGARRAQALGELREPLQTGGNAQDQEAYLKILGDSAAKDHVAHNNFWRQDAIWRLQAFIEGSSPPDTEDDLAWNDRVFQEQRYLGRHFPARQ